MIPYKAHASRNFKHAVAQRMRSVYNISSCYGDDEIAHGLWNALYQLHRNQKRRREKVKKTGTTATAATTVGSDEDMRCLAHCKQLCPEQLATESFRSLFRRSFSVRRGIICGILGVNGKPLPKEDRPRKGLPFGVSRAEFPYLLHTPVVYATLASSIF